VYETWTKLPNCNLLPHVLPPFHGRERRGERGPAQGAGGGGGGGGGRGGGRPGARPGGCGVPPLGMPRAPRRSREWGRTAMQGACTLAAARARRRGGKGRTVVEENGGGGAPPPGKKKEGRGRPCTVEKMEKQRNPRCNNEGF
jgi:hypothetical protein